MARRPEHTVETRAMLPAFLDEIRSARHVVLGTHLNPDGDALGSMLGLSHILKGLDVEHETLCHHSVPRSLQFLPGSSRVRQESKHKDIDLAIVLDLEALDRLGSLRDTFESANRMVVIDHHIPHEFPGDVRIIDTGSPATAAILCDLFFDSEVVLDSKAAECLLTGIVTDTGGFRYNNSTPHSLMLAGRLLELGASLSTIAEEVYMRRPEQSLRILGKAISKLKTAYDGKVAWVCLTRSEMDEYGATDEHTEGIVNEILSIDTVEIAAFIREGKDRYKGSLRSRPKYDVASVAQSFGGGGHRNAAGLNMVGSLEEVETAVIEALGALVTAKQP